MKNSAFLKWLDKHTPYWIVKDITVGTGIGTLIYLGLTYPIGHLYGANGVVVAAVAPLASFAWPLAILIGTVITVMYLYLDFKSIRENGDC